MQSVFFSLLFGSFLSTESDAVGRHGRDFIVGKTKRNYTTEQLLTATRYTSLLFQ